MSRSLNSACRLLSCNGCLPVDLRQQQYSAALWATRQLFLGQHLEMDLEEVVLTKLVSHSPGLLATVNGHLFQAVRKTSH